MSAEWSGDLVVRRREDAAEGVVVLSLASPDGGSLPEWEPGAHVDLVLGNGLVRQYSLCGDPAEREAWRVGVLRELESRGGSSWIHDELREGVTVGARGPRNHFRLETSPRYRFIAGGIGVTPLLPMIRAADAAGAEWELLYGGRTLRSMAFLDELASWGHRVLWRPADEYGLLDLGETLGTPEPDTLVYCCGPEPLLAAVESRSGGWPDGALHLERFSAAHVETPVGGNLPLRVELRRTGTVIEVPADVTILEAAVDAGADVLSSCEDGVCGTCLTPVLGGVPYHRDSVLSAAERKAGDCMLICVSRATSDELVLDL